MLEDFVAGRAEQHRATARRRAQSFGRPVDLDDAGPDELEALAGGQDAPPLVYHLLYRDLEGRVTGRCVTFHRCSSEGGDLRIYAYCHLRKAPRMFRASRITEITDLTTGEIHDDPRGFLATHPVLATAGNLACDEQLAIKRCRPELVILTVVGSADGHFHEDEQTEVVKHVFDRWDGPLREDEVRRRLRSWAADETAFQRALNRLCRGEGDCTALRRSLRRVVDADGEHLPEELVFVTEVERRLHEANWGPFASRRWARSEDRAD